MDAWNVAILAAAGYVAVTALVRLMIRRRNQMLEQFRREVEKEKRRRQFERPEAGQTGPKTSGVIYSGGRSPRPMTKRVYIETVGCQMNVLDSELIVAGLRPGGLRAGR